MSDKNLEFNENRYDEYGIKNFGVGSGITITSGFDVAAQLPLDSRTVVKTYEDLMLMPKDIIYMGLLVYVLEDNKLYQWKEVLQEDKSYKIGWGPIEAEVSAVELDYFKEELPEGEEGLLKITDEIDFDNTPPLMMQKNKDNFFPIVHEDYLYVENEGKTLSDKYQTIYDETLPEDSDKTIVGSINRLDTKMEETLAEFREEITTTLQKLKDDVAQMQQDVQATMDQLEADIIAEMDALQKDLEDMIAAKQKEMEDIIAAMEKEMEDKMAFMDSEFERLMNEINAKIAALEQSVEDRVDQMLRDVDNSILSDLQVNNFMEQINANKALLQ